MRIVLLLLALVILPGCFSFFGVRTPDDVTPIVGDWSAGLDMLFIWSNAISLLMIAICIAVIIWAPIPGLKSWAYIGLTVAAILLGCGIFFAVMKPFIPWIVLGCVGIMCAIGVWFIIANFHLLKKVIRLDTSEYKTKLTSKEQKIVEQCQPLPTDK